MCWPNAIAFHLTSRLSILRSDETDTDSVTGHMTGWEEGRGWWWWWWSSLLCWSQTLFYFWLTVLELTCSGELDLNLFFSPPLQNVSTWLSALSHRLNLDSGIFLSKQVEFIKLVWAAERVNLCIKLRIMTLGLKRQGQTILYNGIECILNSAVYLQLQKQGMMLDLLHLQH